MTTSLKVASRWLALLLVACALAPAKASQNLVVHFHDTWKYNVPTSDPGSTWKGLGFNDATWGSGAGLLGFETAVLPAPGLQTAVGVANGAPVTYLFRKTFTFTGTPTGVSFSLDQIVDDGVSYYLNGNLLGSVRHTPGAWNNLATAAAGDAVAEWNVLTGAATGLVNGTNVLTAEVHQVSANGSDLVFGARLTLFTPETISTSAWRTQNFGSSANSGNGADLIDPDKDGLPNLVEYALNLDPNKQSVGWRTGGFEGANELLVYTRRKSALSELTFNCQWAPAATGPWSTTGVTQQIVSDNGTFQVVKATVATGGTGKMLRLQVVATPSVVGERPTWWASPPWTLHLASNAGYFVRDGLIGFVNNGPVIARFFDTPQGTILWAESYEGMGQDPGPYTSARGFGPGQGQFKPSHWVGGAIQADDMWFFADGDPRTGWRPSDVVFQQFHNDELMRDAAGNVLLINRGPVFARIDNGVLWGEAYEEQGYSPTRSYPHGSGSFRPYWWLISGGVHWRTGSQFSGTDPR